MKSNNRNRKSRIRRSRGTCKLRIFQRDVEGRETIDVFHIPNEHVEHVLERALSDIGLGRIDRGRP